MGAQHRPSTEAVSARRPERLCGLVFPLLQHPVAFGHRFVPRRRRVVRSFGTGRCDIIGRVLEPSHIRALQTGVVVGTRGSGLGGLSSVLGFHHSPLSLACDLGLKTGLSVGIDGLFCKVVGTTSGWGRYVSSMLGICVRQGL